MHGLPERENPTAMARGGALGKDHLDREIDQQDSLSIADRQALRVARRFFVSWPTARLVAELAFTVEAQR